MENTIKKTDYDADDFAMVDMLEEVFYEDASLEEASLENPSTDDILEDNVKLYLSSIGNYPLLTPEKEKEKFYRLRTGDKQAREDIALANLRLVVKVAKEYRGRGVELLDLIQEGNIGLYKAIDKFDVDLDYRFSTYAIWWIRQSVSRALGDQKRTIRLPAHMNELVSRYLRYNKEYNQTHGRDASVFEVAAELDISVKRAANVMKYANREIVSLDVRVGHNEDQALGDFIAIADDQAKMPEAEVEASFLRKDLALLLAKLSERERAVIKMRFGIDLPRSYTLEEIGSIYGISRERVRQVMVKALQKLEHYASQTGLKEYLF